MLKLKSHKWMDGWDGSLKAPLLWAPLCGANNNGPHVVLLWFIADIQFGIGSDFLRMGRKNVLQEVLANLKISPWREQCINCGHGLDQYLFDSDGGGVGGNWQGLGQTELFQQNVEAQPPDIFMQAGLTDPVSLSRNAKTLSPMKKMKKMKKGEKKWNVEILRFKTLQI